MIANERGSRAALWDLVLHCYQAESFISVTVCNQVLLVSDFTRDVWFILEGSPFSELEFTALLPLKNGIMII